MNTLGKIAFYVLFALGAVRLFKGMSGLWPLLYGTTDKMPVAQENGQRRYYSFEPSQSMDTSQVVILIISGLAMVALAFYIRKKVDANPSK